MSALPASVPVVPSAVPARMRSVVHERFGVDPESVLATGQRDVPVPGKGEVLVRVAAASVDRGTWHVMAGLPYPVRLAGFGLRRPRYANPGRSLAGTVVAVGAGVSDFRLGDPVFGTGASALAEYAVARAGRLARMPAGLDPVQAAAVPVSGLTALQAVRDHARIQAGERVLVLGASGGVGVFAVQLAKAAGATVTAVCSGAKAGAVLALGADRVLDYAVDEIGEDGRYDVILDIAGNRPLRMLRRALAPDGRLVLVGGETDGRLLGGTDRQLRAQLANLVTRQRLGTFLASENAADLAELAKLLEAGTLTAPVSHVLPLERAAEAVRVLLDGRAVGKVVVAVR
ncbi:NAD(P)-dependent alcohol dehydrogenase [Naasia sp. SYSU D00057]|uniref:NAD(P)-dependent alcohol dehydrogenase n=1 Tax=Naasia sp. SYSU D00057 TaxID=2817380 RepID=UPI001FEE904F|nr:NAD(P)-dependent alcohol dehydrogenase [Naasia sp. SYSU D00057]